MTRAPWRGIFSFFHPKCKQLKAIKRHAAATKRTPWCASPTVLRREGGNVEAFPKCPILIFTLILPSFGFQSKTPFGLMQATCFMAANDTMAFKLNTDSIANFYSCRHRTETLVQVGPSAATNSVTAFSQHHVTGEQYLAITWWQLP